MVKYGPMSQSHYGHSVMNKKLLSFVKKRPTLVKYDHEPLSYYALYLSTDLH
jgi:hypothetical protein